MQVERLIKPPKVKQHTWDTFVQAAKLKHGGLYLYPDQEYINIKTPVMITCNIHGPFSQRPNDHLTGYGCKQCSVEATGRNKRVKAAAEFEQKARMVHGDRYSYEQVQYINVRTKVQIVCGQHGPFLQTPNNHLTCRAGCPQCVSKHMSIQCAMWLETLEGDIQRVGNGGEFRIPGTRWTADGYCAETNTIYEYHGDFWHGHPSLFEQHIIHPIVGLPYGEIYQRTLDREQSIRELGYNLITMWEHKWKSVESSLLSQ